MATGLEKMLQQILDEANESAKEILDQAKTQSDAILAQARASADGVEAENEAKMAAIVAASEEKAISSAQLKKRQVYLAAKQEIIGDILEKAQQTLVSMDKEKYFAYIEKMLDKYAQPKDGIICLNERDLKRMPTDFERVIAACAKKNGGTLALSKESVAISGGFLLIYGGIEENCSFEAMFHTKREMLADEINRFLF